MLELMKDEQAVEFAHNSVTFLVKPHATAFDRMQVLMAKDPTEFMERCIRQMVVGWRGVSSGGEAVKYSYDLLKLLPETDPKKSTMLLLGNFIMEQTDVVKSEEAAKNA